jgi:hypothetical protein
VCEPFLRQDFMRRQRIKRLFRRSTSF